MSLLEINALGCLQLRSNDKVISHFPTRQVKLLFIFLILNPHIQHSRIKIISLLWPEVPEKNGRNCLNAELWRLRNMLKQLHAHPKLLVHTTRDYVTLFPEGSSMLDFKRFQQLISKADIDEDEVQKERLLRDAVDLYKGPFCEDIHDDWCLVERERMERLYLKALGQLMHCTMQRKNYDEAIDLGHRILLTDPLREEVHRALMVCYLRLGYHAQALEQYRSYSELLAEELDTIPLPETVKLYDQIVNDRIFSQKPDVEFKDKRFQAELRETIQQHQAVSERLYELLESQNKAAE